MFGHCPINKQCDMCLAQSIAQFKGVAACRGERLADELRAGRVDDRILLIDLVMVWLDDIASDPRLLDRLAAEMLKWMTRRLSRAE